MVIHIPKWFYFVGEDINLNCNVLSFVSMLLCQCFGVCHCKLCAYMCTCMALIMLLMECGSVSVHTADGAGPEA